MVSQEHLGGASLRKSRLNKTGKDEWEGLGSRENTQQSRVPG